MGSIFLIAGLFCWPSELLRHSYSVIDNGWCGGKADAVFVGLFCVVGCNLQMHKHSLYTEHNAHYWSK